jgi:hypothetical protein
MKTILDSVRLFEHGLPQAQLDALTLAFPKSHFECLVLDDFHFYRTTFWYPLERAPENIFESVAHSLKALANPSSNVIGVEWWFSVLLTNATPQWLLPCHFDRNDLAQKDLGKLKYPESASVLFLNSVPYGELVVTDQVQTDKGIRPRQPEEMRFIQPARNLYAVFPGHLYHGVIGRMWRPICDTELRIGMAVNWWTERPMASYLADSRECKAAFRLDP